MAADGKNVSADTGYHRYEIAGDNTHYTDVLCSEKVIRCRRVPVRGITLTVGIFFDGTGNNRTNASDLQLAYAHCAGLVGEERARACAKYEKHARAELGNASWQGESLIFRGCLTFISSVTNSATVTQRRR